MMRTIIACLLLLSTNALAQETGAMQWMYIGTYSGKGSEGIYVAGFDAENGKFVAEPILAAKAKAASFLALHPSGKFLYAVDEVEDAHGMKTGAVCSYSIDPQTGKLSLMNYQSSGGKGPCFVGVDRTGQVALVANYGDGVAEALGIDSDGKLLAPKSDGIDHHHGKSVNPARQEGPHAHSFYNDPSGKWGLCCDLGLDRVIIYQLDPMQATIKKHGAGVLSAGSGPRHLAFDPTGRFCYVANELGNTVTAFRWDAEHGAMTQFQSVSTLPKDFNGTSYVAEIVLHPSGKFLYVSNRGHDSIALFTINSSTGEITLQSTTPCGGKWPRNVAIDPTGKYLVAANEHSNSVIIFEIDSSTGALKQTTARLSVVSPVCIRFLVR